ncbi:hypothetical protein ND748_28995 [Frankia sp. AiPs1]|uniref:hypothetical protein n=1 Tax=Frankia sp. AiPs1 TaxID=573493 RepID=UPI0020438590|nr:hypothetical protein [Frankia sp. AiPs1]MCM3925695.1 hypothetical protein [Frankia sp. AiPs1]
MGATGVDFGTAGPGGAAGPGDAADRGGAADRDGVADLGGVAARSAATPRGVPSARGGTPADPPRDEPPAGAGGLGRDGVLDSRPPDVDVTPLVGRRNAGSSWNLNQHA